MQSSSRVQDISQHHLGMQAGRQAAQLLTGHQAPYVNQQQQQQQQTSQPLPPPEARHHSQAPAAAHQLQPSMPHQKSQYIYPQSDYQLDEALKDAQQQQARSRPCEGAGQPCTSAADTAARSTDVFAGSQPPPVMAVPPQLPWSPK